MDEGGRRSEVGASMEREKERGRGRETWRRSTKEEAGEGEGVSGGGR